MATNGKSDTFDTDGLNTNDILAVIIEGLKQLNDNLEVLAEAQESILERLNNLDISGDGFNVVSD